MYYDSLIFGNDALINDPQYPCIKLIIRDQKLSTFIAWLFTRRSLLIMKQNLTVVMLMSTNQGTRP